MIRYIRMEGTRFVNDAKRVFEHDLKVLMCLFSQHYGIKI